MKATFKLGFALLTSTVLMTSAAAQTAMEGGRKLTTTLVGSATTDPDGSGTATIIVNPGQRRVCYSIEVQNIDPATAAHIHLASGGPPLVNLSAPTSGSSQGCTSVTRELALAILKDPGNYAVNIHNDPSNPPAVAIQGTLAKQNH